MESASQQPLFRDDRRGAQVFALVFVWVVFFVTVWQLLFLFSNVLLDYCFMFIVGVGVTFIVIVVQVHAAEKVYPLFYITPLVDGIILQVLVWFGLGSPSGLFNIIIFMAAVNCVFLALAWDEMANRSTSGISALWLSIMPVACLLMIASASILRFGLGWLADGAIDIQWAIWPAVWMAIAIGVIILFILAEHRQRLPDEKWFLPPLLLLWCVLTFTVGLLVMGLTEFSIASILAFVTPALAQFGVASAELEALMRVPSGRVAAAMAFVGGYVMALVCTLLAMTLFIV